MKKLVFVGVLLLSFVIFPEMTTENIIKYIDGKDYKTAAQNLIIYQKELKYKISSEKEAEETVKNTRHTRRQQRHFVRRNNLTVGDHIPVLRPAHLRQLHHQRGERQQQNQAHKQQTGAEA